MGGCYNRLGQGNMKASALATVDRCFARIAGRLAGALLLAGVGVFSRQAFGQCREKPGVQLNERAALSHLLAKRDALLPEHWPRPLRPPEVVVIVTVDRQGKVCNVRPLAGPRQLMPHAVRTVQRHWRFRPFRVDWKPVVAEFPVSVKFVPPRHEPQLVVRSGDSDTFRAEHGWPS